MFSTALGKQYRSELLHPFHFATAELHRSDELSLATLG